MSFFLFIDESGQDRRSSPYEVLAGIAIEDRDLWNLITAIQKAEIEYFGRRYSKEQHELKAKKILKSKVFRHAVQLPPFAPEQRRELAQQCLDEGARAGRNQLTALAQAKIEFVKQVLLLCARFRCKAFASITSRIAPRPQGNFLRKDYAFLFERFFYFLEDISPEALGLIVFDELERSQSHLLVDQMARYFRDTAKGRMRSGQVIPEPFFVHSDLTTAIQIADLLAYIIAWGVQIGEMSIPSRPELEELANLVLTLRYRTTRESDHQNHIVWSFKTIDDLRPRDER
ncbi:MAG: DUF3800 domain-containing protein [Acidobacteriota bacterium]|nr:DUF3800 domain-containing protein [Acidobacteriota bacterium]